MPVRRVSSERRPEGHASAPALGLCQQTGRDGPRGTRPAARGAVIACGPRALSPQVTLMLLDQNNREHVIDAFRPDVTSSSFQRPVGDMNIASGCPLFCPVTFSFVRLWIYIIAQI